MDINKLLADADKNFGETKERARGNAATKLPDGAYIVQLLDATLGESKSTNRPMATFSYAVMEGELTGARYYEYILLDGERTIEPLLWRLRALGVDTDDISSAKDIPGIMDDLIKEPSFFRIRIVSTTVGSNTYQNIKEMKALLNYNNEVAPDDPEDAFSEGRQAGTVAPLSEEENNSSEDEDEDEEVEVGKKVEFDLDGKLTEGIVKEISKDEKFYNIKVGVKVIKDVPLEKLTRIVKEEAIA